MAAQEHEAQRLQQALREAAQTVQAAQDQRAEAQAATATAHRQLQEEAMRHQHTR